MPKPIKIDFVSDIACPWCIIGLRGLEEALERTRDVVAADLHFQPFELNPQMPKGGELAIDHIARKYGRTPAQAEEGRAMIKERAAGVGFTMNSSADSHIYNTHDAHRLLHWAGVEHGDRQQALKHRLFETYFTEQRDPGDADVLIGAAADAGLDPTEAAEILASGRYADEVRHAEKLWQSRGIHSVPAIVVNEKWLISGGQPADAFEQALRNIAAELADA